MATTSADRHKQALARFRLCAQAFRDQMDREREDLAFQVPANHWPTEWQEARRGQVVNNVPVPPRPMLSIPKLDQTFQMLDNQMRAAQLGIQIHAEGGDADDQTATVLQDLYRHIEQQSRANLARSWAYQRAFKCGRGAYRVDKVYDPDTPEAGDQKIVIKRLLDQSCAYFDPFAQEPDFSDMRFAFEAAWMPADLYEDKYPDSTLAAMSGGELETLAHQMPDWISGDDESRAYLVAGYWSVRTSKGDTGPDARHVYYSLINAIEELEAETEWDGQWIPLIPVIGRELIPFDGKRIWTGVIGPAKDGQRLFDVAASNVVEKVGLDTKAPWIAAEGQDEGHELEWQMSAVRNFPMLTYKPVMVMGQLVPPPQKNTSGVNISGDLQLLQLAGGFIQDATTTVDQSKIEQLAQARVAHQTIGNIAGLGEQGRSDFLYNLADVSLPYEAKVVLDLIPKVYDRAGRILRVQNAEGATRRVMVNWPYTQNAMGQPQAVPDGMPVPGNAKMHDLQSGTYGCVVTVGRGFATRNQAQAAMYTELFRADPAVIPAFLPFFLRANEFPPEAVARAEKMVPPNLQDNPQGPNPQQMQAQMGQMQTVIQQLQAQLKEAMTALQADVVKAHADIQKTQINADKDKTLQIMRDATQIAVAKIQAAAKLAVTMNESQDEAIALGEAQAHEAQQAAEDRLHELTMQAQQQGHDADQADQQRQAAAQQQQHDALQGAHQRAHEAGMAAIPPPPSMGGGGDSWSPSPEGAPPGVVENNGGGD